MRNRKTKKFKVMIIMLYITAAAGLLYGFHPLVHALGKKVMTVEIGAEGSQVEASLSENGILTISGKGRTRNYTEETAPFAEYADQITAVKIKDGVIAIGDYLFYNCGNLKGRLTLPSSVIWIGDSAFSGDSAENAPKFSIVESKFMEREIGLPKPGAELSGKPSETEKPSAATPGNASGGSGETVENVSTPSETEKSPEAQKGDMTIVDGESSENPTKEEETSDLPESSAKTEEATVPKETVKEPDTVQEPGMVSERTGTNETSHDSAPGETEGKKAAGQSEDGKTPESGAFTVSSGLRLRGLRTFTLHTSDQTSEESESLPAPEITVEPDSEPESHPVIVIASSSTAQDQEPEEEEETEPTEEYSEDGILTNNLYDGAVAAVELNESQREYYIFETITSQITGTEIFYTGQKGTYICEEANTSFAEAAVQAGYRKAERFIEVDMEGIRESLPVIDGKLYAPELPEGFPVPEDTGDPLFTECFGGWMVESDWAEQGYEAPVYASGEAIPISEETQTVSLYGNWEKTFRLTPEIRVQTEHEVTVYTLIDGENDEMIPETDGYQIDYQWQVYGLEEHADDNSDGSADEFQNVISNELSETIADETSEYADTDSGADLAWRDIEGENDAVYRRISESGDTERYFRVQITVERRSQFRSASEPVTVFSEPVRGEKELAKITVTYEAGDGGAGIPPETQIIDSGTSHSPAANSFTRAVDDGKVFTGWAVTLNGVTAAKPSGAEVGSETVVDANDVALTFTANEMAISPSVTLTAQWGLAKVIYVSEAGKDTNAGTKDSPVRTLGKAYSMLPADGSIYTNVVELLTGYTAGNTNLENSSYRRNVTIRGQGKDVTKLKLTPRNLYQQGDLLFDKITVYATTEFFYSCCRYNLIFTEDTVFTNTSVYESPEGYGVPANTPWNMVVAMHNETFSGGAYGPHGKSEDDPVRMVFSGDNHLGRCAMSGRNMNEYYPTETNPVYTEITMNGGTAGLMVFGGIVDADTYLHGVLNVNGGSIYNVAGSNNNNHVGVTYGSIELNMTGGQITTLNGGPMGRNKSDVTKTVADVNLNISGGNINTIYMGGSTGSITGTLTANISSGTIGTYYGGGYGHSDFVTTYYDGAARVTGDVFTNISGGTFLGNVYAGGKGYIAPGLNTKGSAIIDGNTYLNISGDADIKGNVYGGGQGLPEDVTAGKILGNSSVTISGGTIAGNVYGGGEKGSVDGKVEVNILPGSNIQGTVFGGGNSSGSVGSVEVNFNTPFGTADAPKNIYGAGNGSGTSVQGQSSVVLGAGAKLYGNVFGGGEAGSAGSTNVLLKEGTVSGNVYGGGNSADVSGAVSVVQSQSSTVDGDIYGGSNSMGTVGDNVTLQIAGKAKQVFGGGKGKDTSVSGEAVLTVSDGAEISGNIYGGGAEGNVGTTRIELLGGTVGGSIYGGCNDKGEVSQTNINIQKNIPNTVFGGGYGINTKVIESKVTVYSGVSPTGILYGGGEQGEVDKAQVILSSGSHATDVYGGGSRADVTTSALVTVENQAEADHIYGGSNNAGTVTGAQLSILGTVTSAYGSGQGEETITLSPSVTLESGAVVTELYGGGQKGQTTGGTSVLLKNGSRVKNLFGGGNEAGIEGTATVNTEEGSRVLNIYGGSNSKGTVTQSAVTVGGTVGGTGAVGTDDGPGNVYGGGFGVNTSTAATQVTVGSTAVLTGNVFGGGAEGPVTGNTTVTLNPSSQISGNIYAGGDAAPVGGETLLQAHEGAVITGSLFGGGKGKEAVIQKNTRVLAFADVSGHIFGGGAEGGVIGNTHVDIAKGRVSGDGESGGNVFGGADRAIVEGNTQVHIGWVAADGTQTDITNASLIIEGTVFGGGNTTDSGSNFDATKPFVLGNSAVSVDASNYNIANFNIQKSIFGDGNMCTVGGTRTVSIKNYKALGEQSNTSVQRADVLTLETSQVELTGAVDSANLVPTIAYSLNRIDQLIMKGGSTLRIQAPVNLVKSLISQDEGGNPVKTTATTETAVEPDTRNQIDIQQGVQMELRTSEDVTTMQYGTVSGYMLLPAYDPDPSKEIESGIYVLGNYVADESLGGFLYGSGESCYKKIIPSTDEANWRNWAIGTDMKKDIILVMSDKPAGGKVVEIESPWPADGSIYRLVQNTADEKNHVTVTSTGEKFVLKDPEALTADDPADTTLGISIQAGKQGWVKPMTMGYILGDSENGADGGGYGGLADESIQTLNNLSIKPNILVELTNRNGILTMDDGYPLMVSFQLENVKRLSDGGFSKQGTLTVNIKIRRESLGSYEDILISPGKEYVRATQEYTFATQLGQPGATISKKSAITLQYGRKSDGGAAATGHKLKFSYGDTPTSAGTVMKLPAGVTILAVDRSEGDPVYAHYTVPSGGVEEVELGQFVKNGSSEKYSYSRDYFKPENYLFILDFAKAPDDFSQDNVCVTFETVYGSGESAVVNQAKILFSVVSRQQNYRISSPEATGPDKEGSSYDREAVIPLTLSTYAEGGGLEADTTGREAEMGVYLRLKNRDTGLYVPVPTDWFVTKEGKETGKLTGGGISVILGNGMMNSTSSLGINMKPGSLSAGGYQWEIHLTSSSLAAYPGRLTGTPLYMNFNITDKRYSIKADYKDPSASRLYPSVSTVPRLPLEIRVESKLENGAAADGVRERASLWKKSQTTGEYEQIDFSLLFEGITGTSKDYDLQESQDISYALKDVLPEGTYRLKYELIQTGGGADQLLTYDTENFIVIDK